MPVAIALPTDAQVFLGRLVRLDPDAVVRLRPVAPERERDPDRVALWARLPWRTLVTREVRAVGAVVPGDLTVGAAALLAGVDAAGLVGGPLPRRDHDWRWPLPPPASTVVEEVPAERLREVAAAAAGTLREIARTGVSGRAVGARVVREALLDHVPIVVETGAGERVEVSQRLVQAVVRMGFLGDRDSAVGSLVRVRTAARWVGLAARYGTGWLQPVGGPLAVRPAPRRTV